MHRRDVLKMIPLSIAGMTELSGVGRGGRRDAAGPQAKPLVAEVKQYNGTPTLFLDGEPTFAGMGLVATPSTEGWQDAENASGACEGRNPHLFLRRGKRFRVGRAQTGALGPFRFLHRGSALREDHRCRSSRPNSPAIAL